MGLKHCHIPGPAGKPLQVSGLWGIQVSQCQSYTPAGTEIRLQETWMLEWSYLSQRSVYGLKGNDCEILKMQSPMQILNSLLLVMFRTTQIRIFQRNGTGPNPEKETSREAHQQCFICSDSSKLTICRHPKGSNILPEIVTPICKILLLKCIIPTGRLYHCYCL